MTRMNKTAQHTHDQQVAEAYYMGGITQKELGVYLGRSKSAILRTLQRVAKQATSSAGGECPTPPSGKSHQGRQE